MQLIPVLEIRHGKCVHTEAKNRFTDHVVKQDVYEIVDKWCQQGIERIHLVDVDAVGSGEPENVDLISQLKQQHPKLVIQALGGINSIESAYVWIDAGADYLVLNGRAMRRRNLLDDACVEFPGKILVELDCRQGHVGMGAGEPTFSLKSLAKQLEQDGVVGLVITDVPASGHVSHQNLMSVSQASQEVGMPVFANGGIDCLDDLQQLLASNKSDKMSGVLIGKPLHNGFCLTQAHQLLQQSALS
jgi:phosphoribosylformimino-5-aminoimidazole carboxamide ribotide isomerase